MSPKPITIGLSIGLIALVIVAVFQYTQITALNAQVAQQAMTIQDLKGQIAQLEDLKAKLEANVTNLKAQVADLTAQRDRLREQLAAANATIASLNDKIAALNAQIDSLNSQINDLNRQISQLNDEISRLRALLMLDVREVVLSNSQYTLLLDLTHYFQGLCTPTKITTISSSYAGYLDISVRATGRISLAAFNFAEGYVTWLTLPDGTDQFTMATGHLPIIPGNTELWAYNCDVSTVLMTISVTKVT